MRSMWPTVNVVGPSPSPLPLALPLVAVVVVTKTAEPRRTSWHVSTGCTWGSATVHSRGPCVTRISQ